jgi:putative membrane protein
VGRGRQGQAGGRRHSHAQVDAQAAPDSRRRTGDDGGGCGVSCAARLANLLSWQQRLRSEGDDPDPRFTLANERTFLAWIRTALALVAAGIGTEAFLRDVELIARQLLATALVASGVVVSATAFRRWYRAELALRRREPLPVPALAPLLAYGIAVLSIAALVIVLVVSE